MAKPKIVGALIPHIGTTTGTANVFSITTTEDIDVNDKFTITFNEAATAAATLAISSIDSGNAKGIKKPGGNDMLVKAGTYTLFWDGVNFQCLGEGGEYGTATADKVLTGYSLGTENGLVGGTMPDRGTFNLGLGVSVPAGYYSGGTTANGKKFASGQLNNQSAGTKTVSGLDFTPRVVLISPQGISQHHQSSYHLVSGVLYKSNDGTGYCWVTSISAGQFQFENAVGGTTYYWKAYEN